MASTPPNFANNPTDPQEIVVTAPRVTAPTNLSDEPLVIQTLLENEPSLAGTIDTSALNFTMPDADIVDETGNVVGNIRGGVVNFPPPAQAQWGPAKDLRVKLRVPEEYITPGTPSAGPSDIIFKNGGILFPYTPTISYDNRAEYSEQKPTHSNYRQYFYKNSSVGPINVVGKFTVQNEFEGAVLLGTLHLLRSLTKMRFGDDELAGSPPPVCRFDGYGDYMLYNVPVSIASWRHEIPEGVDFISVGRPGSSTTYGHSLVPVISTINIELNVMYSRREMLAHNVPSWLTGGLRYKGYL